MQMLIVFRNTLRDITLYVGTLWQLTIQIHILTLGKTGCHCGKVGGKKKNSWQSHLNPLTLTGRASGMIIQLNDCGTECFAAGLSDIPLACSGSPPP